MTDDYLHAIDQVAAAADARAEEAHAAIAYRDAEQTFNRAAGLLRMFREALVREQLPSADISNAIIAYQQEYWAHYFRDD